MSFDRCAPREDAHGVACGKTGAGRPGSFAREKFVWLDQVRADAELNPLAFMLAYVLANLVNEREGYAWPSVARLAADCRVTETGIKKVIRRLVECGHLSIELGTGRGKTNRYRWIIKGDNRYSTSDEQEKPRPSQCDQIGQRVLPLSGSKGETTVTPFEPERGNSGSEKGQLAFCKGVTPVTPTLFKESIYDPIYRLSMHRNAQSAPAGFDDFWRVYPKQVARADAMRAFARAVRHAPANEIIRGAMRYAAERKGEDPRFTKHPATWLSKGCWSDPSVPHELARDGPALSGRFDGSIAARMHSDDDFNEVATHIQRQRNRGKKWTP